MIQVPDTHGEDDAAEPLLAQGVEELLRDAYDAPAVPASLLHRLERQITEEWGHSPQIVPARPSLLARTMSVATPWLGIIKAQAVRFPLVRIAACVVVVLGAVAFFGRESSAYDWSSMVRALEKQGVVLVEGPGLKRWLSVSENVLCEQSGDESRLVDTRQRVVLERKRQESQIRRRVLPSQWSGSDRDRLVLMFLLGQVGANLDIDTLQGARLIEERYETVQEGERKHVSLFVRWHSDHEEQINLRLTLDPVTHLPMAYELMGNKGAALAVSYPAAPVSELRAIEFPVGAPVIDVVDPGETVAVASPVVASRGDDTKTASVAVAPAVNRLPAVVNPAEWKPVAAEKRSHQEIVQQIDRTLEQVWAAHQVEPTAPASDEELLRRVFLDLCGRTPTVHEIRSYLADNTPGRYERLVDRLLEHRDHASHLAAIWRTFLIPEGVDLTAFGGVDAFDSWLADQFGNNEPYDRIVRGLLLAEGRLSRSGPLLFYSAAKLDPDHLAARSARVFLGMRLECAQCHDHPFEPWSQEDFWGLAAFFAQISRPRGDLNAASTVMQVRDVDHGEVRLPQTETVIPPGFPNGDALPPPDPAANVPPPSRRQQLARWMTAAENPYFARATANRVWAILFGKGIVDPVDDFGTRHPPKSPELLELLAGRFVATGLDIRDLFRTVALSRAYRLSSGAATADPRRTDWFAQMSVKTFTAEQVYDCMAVATMLDATSNADPFSFNLARAGNSERERFLQQFRTPTGRSTEYLGGIPQALTLMNGTLIDNATGVAKSGLLKSLEAPFFTNKQRIEVLYLAVLSRHPRPAEWELLKEFVNDRTSPQEVRENLSDILWALLNSAEFTMNH
jgi:hypothetical protein